MIYTKVSHVMTEEAKAAILQLLTDLNTAIDAFTVKLTVEERQAMLKMGNKSIVFVDQSLKYALKYPELAPSYLDVAELERDFVLAENMRNFLKILEPVVEKISDCHMAAGADAFSGARSFYDSVKAAAKNGAPGADALVAELKKRFKRKSSPKTNEESKDGKVDRSTKSSSKKTK